MVNVIIIFSLQAGDRIKENELKKIVCTDTMKVS
jgi:hypothetical protein